MSKTNWGLSNKRIDLFLPVISFLAITGFCILFSEQGSVAWSIFSKHIKDVLIVSLLIMIIRRDDSIRNKMSAMTVISYFVSSFSLRLGCAINSGFDYKIYRLAVNDPVIGNLANSIIFMLLLLIITTNGKYER
jgi:hypothetical protein